MAVAPSQKSETRSIKRTKKTGKATKNTRKRKSIVAIGQEAHLVKTEIAITGEDLSQTTPRVTVIQVKTEREGRIAADDEDLAQEVDRVRTGSSGLRLVVDLTTIAAQPCFRIIAIAVDKSQKQIAKMNRNLVEAWDLIWPFMEKDSIKSRKWINFVETRSKIVAKKSSQKMKRRLD